jgi:von Willebrand factor type A domain
MPTPGLHPLRFLLGTILSVLLILGGLGFGGSKGVLPASLAAAAGNFFGKPDAPGGSASGATAGEAGPVPVPKAGAADHGSTTAMVLDISGSMESPAQIPSGFPQAAELKEKQDAFGSLLEQAKSGKKVTAGILIAGISGIADLVKLSSKLDDYLKAQGIDPATISKLSALKVSTKSMLSTLAAERQGLGLDHRVGLVTFSDTANVLAPLNSDMAGLAAQVDTLKTEGSTNMGDGLQNGLTLVQDQPGAGIVLLTDGWNNTGMTDDQILTGPLATAVARGIPICAIGIGESSFDVDQAFLTQVASRSGGAYYFVGDRASLAGAMLACHNTISGQKVAEFSGRVTQGQMVSVPQFTIAGGKHRLSLSLTWPGSDLDLQVKDARGQVIGAGGHGTLSHQPGLIVATLPNPPAGAYTVQVNGREVSRGGEDFFLSASTEGQTTDRHFASLAGRSAAISGPLAGTRNAIRTWVTISALVAGVAMLLMTLRGIVRRLRARRLAARGERLPGKFLVPFLLYLCVVGGLIVLAASAGLNYLWETPLITLPKI